MYSPTKGFPDFNRGSTDRSSPCTSPFVEAYSAVTALEIIFAKGCVAYQRNRPGPATTPRAADNTMPRLYQMATKPIAASWQDKA